MNMGSLDFYYSQSFICKFNNKKLNHYYKKPKLFPCGNSACANCIVNEINQDNESFFCIFCNKMHKIHETTPNLFFERLFIENLNVLVENKVVECKNLTATVKDDFAKREKRLNKIIDFIEDEIEIRFESIKIEFDKLNLKLLNTVNKVERRSLKKSRKIDEIQHNTELIENSSRLSRCLKQLNRFKLMFDEAAEINYYQIGYLNALNMLNIHKIKTNSPGVVEFEKMLKYPTCACTLNNEKLIITDNQCNEICILDTNFKVINRVNRINDIMFNGLRGITTNNKDYVYICDTGNDRVIIADINLKNIKRVIGQKGKNPNEFDWPTEVSFYNDSIFVLDEINYRIQRFTSTGDFMNIVYTRKVTSIERSNIFKKLSVDNNLIAISNRYFVFLINFEGIELQKFGHLGVSLKSIFMADNYLLTHNSKGILTCYGLIKKNGSDEDKTFSLVFERNDELFKKPTSCITKFDDNLLLVCMCDNLLISL